jgi:hypothetical protein
MSVASSAALYRGVTGAARMTQYNKAIMAQYDAINSIRT